MCPQEVKRKIALTTSRQHACHQNSSLTQIAQLPVSFWDSSSCHPRGSRTSVPGGNGWYLWNLHLNLRKI